MAPKRFEEALAGIEAMKARNVAQLRTVTSVSAGAELPTDWIADVPTLTTQQRAQLRQRLDALWPGGKPIWVTTLRQMVA